MTRVPSRGAGGTGRRGFDCRGFGRRARARCRVGFGVLTGGGLRGSRGGAARSGGPASRRARSGGRWRQPRGPIAIARPAASSAASRPTLSHRTRRRSAGPPRARRRATLG